MRITADRPPSIKSWNQTVTFLWIETRLYYFFRNWSRSFLLLLLMMKLPKERKKACNKYWALDPTVELKSESPRKKKCHLPALFWILSLCGERVSPARAYVVSGCIKGTHHPSFSRESSIPAPSIKGKRGVCVWPKDPPHQSLLMKGGKGAPQSLIFLGSPFKSILWSAD